MNLNKKWNVINTVLIVSSIVVILSFGIMMHWLNVSETVKNNKLSFDSIIDVNNKRIDSDFLRWNLYTNSWWLKSSITTLNLDESKSIEVFIPKNNISTSTIEVSYLTGSNTNYLWLELSKIKDNKLLVNKNIDTRWWFIIRDSSSWSEAELDSNLLNQEYLLRNNSINELSDFITWELNKIWEPGSYILFDFWFTTIFNSFNFQLTNESKWAFPNIIQLTFDNWIQHNFFIDDTKDLQYLLFPEISTRYIRLDILSSSDWRVDIVNSNIISNIARNILESEINIVHDIPNKKITISYPLLSTINWVKFINLYSWYDWVISSNPFKSLLKSDTSFDYYYKDSPLDTIYLELCSEINACLPLVSKTIN